MALTAVPKPKSGVRKKRESLRAEFWPDEVAWLGPDEKGYFCGPRTLPLLVSLLRSKELSKDKDPSRVYVELLSRHMGEGVVEMTTEEEHAYAAGYQGATHAIRSWRDGMKILEDAGFIKSKAKGNLTYGTVLLVHPAVAVERLHKAKRIPERWWNTYRSRQIEVKEPSGDELLAARGPKGAGRKRA